MNISVLIPVHELTDSTEKLFNKAIESYRSLNGEKPSLYIITTNEIKNRTNIKEAKYIIVNEGERTNFQHLVNKGVNECDGDYFSILELDDLYCQNIFINFEKYFNSGYEADVYLPLTEVIDFKNGETFSYINQAFWANSFSEELGYLDFECMQEFIDVNFTGAIFNKKKFLEIGGLKESMKMHFWHEYVLRALQPIYNQKMFVIPKVGYKHYVNRGDSFYGTITKEMTMQESEWWFDLGKKEYLFTKDREKTYED